MNIEVANYTGSGRGLLRRCIVIMLGVLTLCALVFITVPFISFGKPLSIVVADAAHANGIDEHEYSIEFSSKLKDKHGSTAYGTYTYVLRDGQIHHIISVRKTFSRPIMIGTIFHEFAHAAQTKYELALDGLTVEQHAEVLSFSVMRASGYKWDSVHLLPTHMFAKSKEYNVSSQLWSIALTGTGAMSVNVEAQGTPAINALFTEGYQ